VVFTKSFLTELSYHPLLTSPIKGEEILGMPNTSPPLVGGVKGRGTLGIMET
jgi:hypothetical protein